MGFGSPGGGGGRNNYRPGTGPGQGISDFFRGLQQEFHIIPENGCEAGCMAGVYLTCTAANASITTISSGMGLPAVPGIQMSCVAALKKQCIEGCKKKERCP